MRWEAMSFDVVVVSEDASGDERARVEHLTTWKSRLAESNQDNTQNANQSLNPD